MLGYNHSQFNVRTEYAVLEERSNGSEGAQLRERRLRNIYLTDASPLRSPPVMNRRMVVASSILHVLAKPRSSEWSSTGPSLDEAGQAPVLNLNAVRTSVEYHPSFHPE